MASPSTSRLTGLLVRIIRLTPEVAEEWDKVVQSSPDGWCFSLASWLEMVTPIWGMEQLSFAVSEGENLVAVMPLHWLPSAHRLSSSGWGHGGPAVQAQKSSAERSRLWCYCLEHVDKLAAQLGAQQIDVSISPLTLSSIRNEWGVSPLVEYGFQDVSGISQVIDLRLTNDELWAGLKKDARYEIQRAVKAGYSVDVVEWPSFVREYYEVHVENYLRTKVTPHPIEYFQGIADQSKRNFVLRVGRAADGAAVAFHNTACFGDGAMYHTGCSRSSHLKSGINYLLFWEAIIGAKSAGQIWYEAGEIYPEARSGKQYGLSMFKQKFGGAPHRVFRGRKLVQVTNTSQAPSITKKLMISVMGRVRRTLSKLIRL
jgi:hypothetical protein